MGPGRESQSIFSRIPYHATHGDLSIDSLLSLGSPTNLDFDSDYSYQTIRIVSSHEFPYYISALGWAIPSNL